MKIAQALEGWQAIVFDCGHEILRGKPSGDSTWPVTALPMTSAASLPYALCFSLKYS
jgi:hypothetical protein